MRSALACALGLSILLVGPSGAQETVVREARCWTGSSTFSTGAALFVGPAVSVCDSKGVWMASAEAVSASGCLLDGELSSVGAVVGVRNGNAMLLECGADGRWASVRPAPED